MYLIKIIHTLYITLKYRYIKTYHELTNYNFKYSSQNKYILNYKLLSIYQKYLIFVIYNEY